MIHATAVDPPNWPSWVTHSPTSSNTVEAHTQPLGDDFKEQRGVNRSNGLVMVMLSFLEAMDH